MKKRGQIQSQSFIFILVLIVIAGVVFFGIKSIITISKNAKLSQQIQFKAELTSSVNSLSSKYGDVEFETFSIPSEFSELCFIGSTNKDELPSLFTDKHPIVADTVITGDNAFLIGEDFTSFSIGKMKISSNVVCIPVINGKIRIRIEGKGDGTSISAFDTLTASVDVPDGTTTEDIIVASTDYSAGIEIPSGTVITYPDGAEAQITVNKITTPPTTGSFSVAGEVFDFQPDGTEFNPAIPITISYDSDFEGDPENLIIYYYDGSDWISLPEPYEINPQAHTITGYTDHFTPFMAAIPLESEDDDGVDSEDFEDVQLDEKIEILSQSRDTYDYSRHLVPRRFRLHISNPTTIFHQHEYEFTFVKPLGPGVVRGYGGFCEEGYGLIVNGIHSICFRDIGSFDGRIEMFGIDPNVRGPGLGIIEGLGVAIYVSSLEELDDGRIKMTFQFKRIRGGSNSELVELELDEPVLYNFGKYSQVIAIENQGVQDGKASFKVFEVVKFYDLSQDNMVYEGIHTMIEVANGQPFTIVHDSRKINLVLDEFSGDNVIIHTESTFQHYDYAKFRVEDISIMSAPEGNDNKVIFNMYIDEDSDIPTLENDPVLTLVVSETGCGDTVYSSDIENGNFAIVECTLPNGDYTYWVDNEFHAGEGIKKLEHKGTFCLDGTQSMGKEIDDCCADDFYCESGVCNVGRCAAYGKEGDSCSETTECKTNLVCADGACTPCPSVGTTDSHPPCREHDICFDYFHPREFISDSGCWYK
ncbi:MAG: hypothetical protein ABH879_01615 [archaeon]